MKIKDPHKHAIIYTLSTFPISQNKLHENIHNLIFFYCTTQFLRYLLKALELLFKVARRNVVVSIYKDIMSHSVFRGV